MVWPTSAYIHVPFCRRRCHYCDFAIVPVGDRGHHVRYAPWRHSSPSHSEPKEQYQEGNRSTEDAGTLDQWYVDVVLDEIAMSTEMVRHDLAEMPAIQTLYIGGGTPSLLDLKDMERLICAVSLTLDAEVTLEMDPGTFDAKRARAYRDMGVTRVSIGVQSFDDAVLKACGRAHSAYDVDRALEALHRGGFGDAFSLDLISGLPGMSIERWQHDLDRLVTIRPPHVSIYDLSIEKGTLFDRWYREKTLPFPDEDTAAQMYRDAVRVLVKENGYDHYEVSNYARTTKHRSRHNMVYWRAEEFWGWGMSACSFVRGKRFERPRKLADYIQWVSAGCIAMDQVDGASVDEWVMLRLRMKEGISLDEMAKRFGRTTADAFYLSCTPYLNQQFLACDRYHDQVFIRVVDPGGYLLLSYVTVHVLSAMDYRLSKMNRQWKRDE